MIRRALVLMAVACLLGACSSNETTVEGGPPESTASLESGAAGGTVTQGVAGKISKAVEFDGSINSHVTLSDGSMAADQTWTFSAWVRADTIAGDWDAIFHKGRDSDDDWQGLWINGSNRLSLGWEADGGGGNVDKAISSSSRGWILNAPKV